jgi:hypothetical protein
MHPPISNLQTTNRDKETKETKKPIHQYRAPMGGGGILP